MKRSNALLLELFFVTLFFALASVSLAKMCLAVQNLSIKASARNTALREAQNYAEMLYAADDADAYFESLGFEKTDAGWFHTDEDGIEYTIACTQEGAMRTGTVAAVYRDEALLTLPCSRYFAEEVRG